MIIYNITINIDNDIHDEWLSWMKKVYIPEVMQTGYFVEQKICKVLVEEEQGTTYSVQFTSKNIRDFEAFKTHHAQRIQGMAQQYAHKLVAFSTLLQVV